ncbi:MAG: acyl-CoA thioesterase [Blautia sp.]
MTTFTCTHKAQYYETDQMGIIHHSNYIRWFEEARVYLLEQIGCPYHRLEEEGILSPVLEITCQYHSMVHFGDLVDIRVFVETFNGIKLSFGYEIRDHETGEVRTTGTSRHCFMDKEGNLISLKRSHPAIYETLQQYK